MPKWLADFSIPGRPITKKNSSQIFFKGKGRRGKPFKYPSKQFKRYENDALWFLKQYDGPRFGRESLHLKCLYYMPNRRSWPDLLGLLQATWDILEEAGIIKDDKYIVSADGSRIVGVDKKKPRVEFYIKRAEHKLIEELEIK